ncbi:hypothetical protein CHS0354_011837 [Potamilus streckersoni]|uniref:von Hippel-Lindau disease tumour suppressor beta domain-containing protein n=1 Tax=Potamilus streckersoni TaxID=2493646 RepID=A0AAE0TFP6_9BIVA|nr:hypothetical protein CHS0354_011837 [Potamilus streckersoni]
MAEERNRELQMLRSLNNNDQSFVTFCNRTLRLAELFWIDYNGQYVRYARIPPGKATLMNTYVTHPWIAKDAFVGLPFLLNRSRVFFPVACDGRESRDRVNITIPVYPLRARSMEVVHHTFSSTDIAKSDLPAALKQEVLKLPARKIPYTDYPSINALHFEEVLNEEEVELNEEDENSADEDSGNDGEGYEMWNEENNGNLNEANENLRNDGAEEADEN